MTKHQFKICKAVALGLTHYYLNDQHDKREITDNDRINALHIIPKLPKGWMRKADTYPWSCMNNKKGE